MEAEVESLPQCSGDGGPAAWFAWPFFSIRFDGGGWVAFHLFSLFCAAWFTFVFDGGGAACHINRGSMEFELMVN